MGTFFKRRGDINSLGRKKKRKEVQLSSVFDDQFLKLTIDSAAGEDVLNDKMAPQTSNCKGPLHNRPRNYVQKWQEGPSRGHQRRSHLGEDVNKALMSMAQICDVANTIMLNKDGGIIKNSSSGEKTKFRRKHDFYRMTVKLHENGLKQGGVKKREKTQVPSFFRARETDGRGSR